MTENNDSVAMGTTEKKLGGATGHGWMPGQTGNPNGRPKQPSFRKLIQDMPELNKQAVIDRMYAVATKGRSSDAARAAEWLARNSDDKTAVSVATEEFTITIAPSAAMTEDEEE